MTLLDEIAALAHRIAKDSSVMPLQRCVRREQPAVEAILAQGVTTARLATALAGAGVRQRSGASLTHGHFRQIVMRMREEIPVSGGPARRRTPPKPGNKTTPQRQAAPLVSDEDAALDLFRREARRSQAEENRIANRPDFSNGLWAPDKRS